VSAHQSALEPLWLTQLCANEQSPAEFAATCTAADQGHHQQPTPRAKQQADQIRQNSKRSLHSPSFTGKRQWPALQPLIGGGARAAAL